MRCREEPPKTWQQDHLGTINIYTVRWPRRNDREVGTTMEVEILALDMTSLVPKVSFQATSPGERSKPEAFVRK